MFIRLNVVSILPLVVLETPFNDNPSWLIKFYMYFAFNSKVTSLSKNHNPPSFLLVKWHMRVTISEWERCEACEIKA